MTNDRTYEIPRVPPKWGDDPLSKFIQNSIDNTYASFHNLKSLYGRLVDIHVAFRTIADNIDRTPDWFASFFLFRSHAAYLGAVRLALSGQVPEAYMVLRGCLENALYGFYVARKPSTQEIWLRRHDDAESKRKVKGEFKVSNLLGLLAVEDEQLRRIAGDLYETTIDFGGHPNERAILSVMKQQLDESKRTYQSAYMIGNEPPLHCSLECCAQIGVCALSIFQRIYPERFDILGLSNQLRGLKEGLEKKCKP